MKAHLSTDDLGGNLVAKLESGDYLISEDAATLAEQLWLAGVTADSLTVTAWKTNLHHGPISEQIVAIKYAFLRCERRAYQGVNLSGFPTSSQRGL